MKNPLIDLCAEFSRQARFRLSLMPFIPNNAILCAMKKEGWRVEHHEPTAAELASNASALGHGCLIIPTCTVKNPQGQDVFTDPDPATYKTYRETVRRTAARLYGITLK